MDGYEIRSPNLHDRSVTQATIFVDEVDLDLIIVDKDEVGHIRYRSHSRDHHRRHRPCSRSCSRNHYRRSQSRSKNHYKRSRSRSNR
jgi:hypothetical protein